MTIYSTAQSIETHGKLGWDISVDEILHCRQSYAQAVQRYLVSAILFLRDRDKRDLVLVVFLCSCNMSMESN